MTASEIFSTIRDWAVGKFQPRGDYASIGDLSGKLDFDGDSASNTISFTSEDSISPAGWTDLPVLSNGETHSGIMQKISVMFKNIRYLWQLLGSTDISAIGDGTVSGGLSALATSISALNLKTYNTLEQIGFTEPTTAAEIYTAIPDGSQVLLIDTSVTDTPTDGGGATVLFVKNSTHRGFILATGKTGKTYIMHLNSTGGNPTGVWVKLVEETDLDIVSYNIGENDCEYINAGGLKIFKYNHILYFMATGLQMSLPEIPVNTILKIFDYPDRSFACYECDIPLYTIFGGYTGLSLFTNEEGVFIYSVSRADALDSAWIRLNGAAVLK